MKKVTASWKDGRTEVHDAYAVETEEGQYKLTLGPGDLLLVPREGLRHLRVQDMLDAGGRAAV